MKKHFLALAFLLALSGSSQGQNMTTQDSIRVFYDSLFVTLETQFIYRDSIDFEPLKPVFMERALNCTTFVEALYQTTPLFDTIGGTHCMIFWQEEYIQASPKREFTQDDFSEQFLLKYETNPSFEVKVLEDHYGYILMPGFLTFSGDADSLSRLTHTWYDQIVEAETNHDIKGWILDLRFNGGGSSAPMTLALYNLLGDTEVYNELDHKLQSKHAQFMQDGMYHYADTLEFSIQRAGQVDTEIPVAVINGLLTGSAGENVAIAFRGRENVQYIGEETFGFLTGNDLAKLPFGATMPITVGYFADRNAYYTPTVQPDVPVSKGDNFDDLLLDENIQAALQFINGVKPPSIEGDFNGDGKQEQLWIETTKENGNSSCILRCSDPSIPALEVKQSANGILVAEGDLNGDGVDEFSIVSGKDEKGWSSCQLYTLKKGHWEKAIASFLIKDWKASEDRIQKGMKRKQITILQDVQEGEMVKRQQVVVRLR